MTGTFDEDTREIEIISESGPQCPDCLGRTEIKQHHLTNNEYTTIISCTDCEFEIESESNRAAQSRRERR